MFVLFWQLNLKRPLAFFWAGSEFSRAWLSKRRRFLCKLQSLESFLLHISAVVFLQRGRQVLFKMPLEIYFDLFSQPCRSVYIFAKKNNIPFEHKEMSLFQGAQYGEEFGKISILRKLPAIKDGDFCLAESVSILVYLTEKFQTPDHWYPADLQKRARVNEYLSWQHTSIRLYGAKVIWLMVMIPKGLKAEVPKEKVDSTLEYFEWSLKLFEEKFLQDKFIAGDQISLADLVAIVELMQPLGAGLDVFESRPKLQAWKDRVRKAIGAELFDESHRRILSLRETVETMDFTALEAMKSRLLKYFLS